MDGRAKLQPPDGHKRGLLRSCCTPRPGEAIEAMLASEIDFTIFFYNPNIHPQREYLLRRGGNVCFAAKRGVPFIDVDCDKGNWFAHAERPEWEPEARCALHDVLRQAL